MINPTPRARAGRVRKKKTCMQYDYSFSRDRLKKNCPRKATPSSRPGSLKTVRAECIYTTQSAVNFHKQ